MKSKGLFSNLFKKNKKILSNFNEEELEFLKKINGIKYDTLSSDKKELILKFSEFNLVRCVTNYEKLDLFTVSILKSISKDFEISIGNKKQDIIENIKSNIEDEDLAFNENFDSEFYILTDFGKDFIKSLSN